MAISSAVAISVSIICAVCAVVIAAATHRVVATRNKSYDDNGAPQTGQWIPNNYPAEQMKRLAEVRWRAKKMIWEVARDYRLAQGQGVPDWYPGDHWTYDNGQALSASASVVEVSTDVLTSPDGFERVPIGSPANIGYAYRNLARLEDDNGDVDEEESGTPVGELVAPSTRLPFMLKRWTQHGAPCHSQPQVQVMEGEVPRIMLNDRDIPLTDYNSNAEAHISPYPRFQQRNSSVYSADILGQMPVEPPVVYATSSSLMEAIDEHTTQPKSPTKSGVHQMIAQWEKTRQSSQQKD